MVLSLSKVKLHLHSNTIIRKMRCTPPHFYSFVRHATYFDALFIHPSMPRLFLVIVKARTGEWISCNQLTNQIRLSRMLIDDKRRSAHVLAVIIYWSS